MPADGFLHGGFVARVHVEGVGDAGLRDFDAVGVVGGEGAILKRGGEEVDYGEGEALFGGRLGRLVGGDGSLAVMDILEGGT